MITADNVHVIFHRGSVLETTALRGANLRLATGEFTTLIGSNGAGKSTLLNVLAGAVSPTSGRVLIDDKDVSQQPAHQRAAHVSRVFQDPLSGTCADLTIEENMALAAARGRRRGWRLAVSATAREMFRQRLSLLGLDLENRLSEKVSQLSGGQRQAVSLLMAALSESALLLLDEHTAALDPRMAEFVLQLTRRLSGEYNLTTLMVTHSMKSALACGTRTVMLHRGKVMLDVCGEERQKMTVSDLLRLFNESSGQEADDDRLLLE